MGACVQSKYIWNCEPWRVSGRNKYIVPGEYLTTPTLLHASGRWYLKNIPQHDVYRRLFIARYRLTSHLHPPSYYLSVHAYIFYVFFLFDAVSFLASWRRKRTSVSVLGELQKLENYNFCLFSFVLLSRLFVNWNNFI